jgi:hypothetical protein
MNKPRQLVVVPKRPALAGRSTPPRQIINVSGYWITSIRGE